MGKAIKVGRGFYTPYLIYGGNNSNVVETHDKVDGHVIMFDNGQYTPKSITVGELMKSWYDTGNMPVNSLSNPKIKRGDTVIVSEAGVDWMVENSSYGTNYWMYTESIRQFTVTDFFSSGTRCKCNEGILPPMEFLTVIGSSFDKKQSLSAPQDGDWIDIIIQTMHKEYGDDDESVDEIKEIMRAEFKNNGGYIHGLCVDAPNFDLRVIADGQARQYLEDHFTDADPYYLGGWNHTVFTECYPEIADALIALANTEAYDQVGQTILSLKDGVYKLVDYLITKYGIKQTIGDHLNYYDGKALEFVYYGNKYYIVRED